MDYYLLRQMPHELVKQCLQIDALQDEGVRRESERDSVFGRRVFAVNEIAVISKNPAAIFKYKADIP